MTSDHYETTPVVRITPGMRRQVDIVRGQRMYRQDGRWWVWRRIERPPYTDGADIFRWWKPSHLMAVRGQWAWSRRYWGSGSVTRAEGRWVVAVLTADAFALTGAAFGSSVVLWSGVALHLAGWWALRGFMTRHLAPIVRRLRCGVADDAR